MEDLKKFLKFPRIGSSINIDKRLYQEDIEASIVHTNVIKQKILSKISLKLLKILEK